MAARRVSDIGDIDEKSDQGAARAEQRRQAAREDRYLDDIYRQGQRDARTARRSSSSSSRSTPRSSVRRAARTSTRRATRELRAPAARAVFGATHYIGLMLALIALYLVVTNADTFAAFINGTSRGLHWLASPTKSIPYAH